MKRFLLIGAACIAFLSCSKDLVLDVNRGAAIEFTVAAQTRAQELTLNNLLTFYATAVDPRQDVNYFTDLPYMKSGEYYVSSPSYYWPGDNAPLNIYAYAPSAANLGVSADSETILKIDRNTQILADFSPAAEIADQQDFISAVLPEFKNPDNGNAVQLAFKHQLVQIEIKAKNSNPGEIYHIKGVKIAQVKSKGDFDFSDQTWTLDDEARADYIVQYDDARILDPYGVNLMNVAGDNIIESYSDNAMLLPQEIISWDPQDDQQNTKKGAYIAVLMKITSSSGASVTPTDQNSGYQWVAAPFPSGTEWVAGNKYIYTLDFTNGASYSDPASPGGGELLVNEITFDVDIVPWNERNENISDQELQTDLLIGKWLFKDAMISVSLDNEKVNEIYYNNLEEVIQFGASESIEFVSEDTFIIGGVQEPAHLSAINGILYVSGIGLPSNVVAYVKSFDAENFTLEYYFTARDIEYGETGADLLYTFTFNYVKDTWGEEIVGQWYFDTATLIVSNDIDQIQERRKLGSVDFAESLGYGISSVNFRTDLTFDIDINKSLYQGSLSSIYLNIPDYIPQDPCSARVKSCNGNLLQLELSYSEEGENKYTLIFDFTRNEDIVQQKWRENIVGQWEFQGIDLLYIYDDGTIEEAIFDQEFNPAFNLIDFRNESTFYLLGVSDPFEARLEPGVGFLLDFEYMRFLVNEITSESMQFSISSRINLNGTEVYQEMIAHYAKLN